MVHKKRELSVNLLRFFDMALAGAGCGGGEPGQSCSAECVILVWTQRSGHCLRRLSWALIVWFPAPDCFRPRRGRVHKKRVLRVDSLRFARRVVPHALAGTTGDKTELVHTKGELSVDTHRFPPRVVVTRGLGMAGMEAGEGRACSPKACTQTA